MKVILSLATTADYYIAREDGSVGFLDPFNESGEDYGMTEFLESISVIAMGNTTFQEYHTHPGFFEYYEGKQIYVFSRNPNLKHEKVTYISETPKEFLKGLNSEKNVWLLGGADLIREFQIDDLIDEYIITIMPVLIGNGIPLFRKSEINIDLKLVKTESFKSGVVVLHYTRS